MYALLIFAVAFAVRLLHVWQLSDSPFFTTLLGDANGYDQWAQRLAAGDWIGSDVFYQAPLYPYFLGVVYAMFDRDLLIVRIVQALIGSASCVLLGLAGARLFSRQAGLVAGLALALWAPAIFFDALLQKSVLDMFFLCLALWGIAGIREQGTGIRAWVALGATMGALALTRENALALIGVIATYLIVGSLQNLRRTSVAQFVAFAFGLALVLSPVVARNYAVGGGLYLTTSQFGSNFYIGNNPAADGTYASIRFGRGAPEFERLDATEVAQEAAGRTLSPAEVSSYWTDRAMAFITSQPAAWLKLTGRKVLLLFNRAEMIDTESQESYAEYSTPLWVLGWVGHFGVLVPLAVFGMIATWPDRRRLWIVHALFWTYAASVVLFFVFARYRYPLVPFLILFAAAPFDAKVRNHIAHLRAGNSRKWVAAGAVVLVAIFANWPLLSPTLMQAITENNLGTALQEQKQFDQAIRHHERAIELRPDYAPAYNNLGAALRAAGRIDEAVARYRQALALKPDFASASYNLANAQLEQGNAADSAASFRQSLQSTPNSVEAHNNLGTALARKGDIPAAMTELRAALAIDDRSVHAHRNLGNMLIDAGRRAEGMAHLERAATIAPSEPEAVYDIGTILLQEQDFAGAAARFEAALKIKPDWAEAYNNLGIALASQGRVAEALTHFERAVALKPSLTDARANRDQARAALKR
jgi:tetratricopeptide (TPR) repeat protein